PELSAIDPNLPEALAEVVEKCLAKDVKERYQSVEEVVGDLNVARNNLAAIGIRTSTAGEAVAESGRHLKAISSEVPQPRVTSSVEYLVNEVKGHRLSAILGGRLLVILAEAFVSYFY